MFHVKPLLTAAVAMGLLACQSDPSEVARLSRDASRSVQIYAGECDEGDAAACYALGLVYELGGATRQGVEADPDHARALIERACAGGHARACAHLGHADGSGEPTAAPSE